MIMEIDTPVSNEWNLMEIRCAEPHRLDQSPLGFHRPCWSRGLLRMG